MNTSRGHQPRACLRCHTVKDADQFAWGDGKRGQGHHRRRRGVCLECEAADAKAKAERAAAREKRRATWTHEDGTTVRRCSRCHEVKPLDSGFYKHPDRTARHEYRYWCKSCDIARITEYKRDVQSSAVYREAKNRAQREWRRRNPEAAREQRKRYWARLKADPDRYDEFLERCRMNHALRRERRDGVQLGTLRRAPTSTPVPDDGLGRLPAAPLAAAIAAYAARDGVTEQEVCEPIGVSVRNVFAWRTGERQLVQFDVADRVLTALDLCWWDVWDQGDSYVRETWEGQVAA